MRGGEGVSLHVYIYICTYVYIYIFHRRVDALSCEHLCLLSKKKKRQVNHNGTVFFLVGFNAMAEVG